MIFLIFLLILLSTALLVSYEFALVSSKPYEYKDNFKVLKAFKEQNKLLSMIQVGITLLSFLMGSIAEPQISHLLHDYTYILGSAEHIIIAICIVMTHVLFGEAIAKSVGLILKKQVLLRFTGFMLVLMTIMYPLVWILNTANNVLCRVIGIHPAGHGSTLTADDIMAAAEEAEEHGIDEEEMSAIAQVAAMANETVIQGNFLHRKDLHICNEISTIDLYTYGAVVVGQLSETPKIVTVSSYMLKRDAICVNIDYNTEKVSALTQINENNADYARIVDQFGGFFGIFLPRHIKDEVFEDITE